MSIPKNAASVYVNSIRFYKWGLGLAEIRTTEDLMGGERAYNYTEAASLRRRLELLCLLTVLDTFHLYLLCCSYNRNRNCFC